MAIHDLQSLPATSALKYLNLEPVEAEKVMCVVTSWAQGGRPEDIEGWEQTLRGIRGIVENSPATEQLWQSISRYLSQEQMFAGNSASITWSGTDIFGNLRVNQCLGRVALSTLVRPATAMWFSKQWPNETGQSRFARLLILFYAGSKRATEFLRDGGDPYPGQTYDTMRQAQLQSDKWIIKSRLYNLIGPASGGGVEIEATLTMRIIVLFVRDLAIPIATIIGMIAIVATSRAWANNVGTSLAIASAIISFIDIMMISLWNTIFPGTLAQWHVNGMTQISGLSENLSTSSQMLEMYNLAGVATTFAGTVKRTATGHNSDWAPDEGQVGFHSTKPVCVNMLAKSGLVWGRDRVIGGPVFVRNVYGRTTTVKVEVLEEVPMNSGKYRSYHMPSSGEIEKTAFLPTGELLPPDSNGQTV